MLIEKVHQQTFLYDIKLPDYRDQNMRAIAWEGIGKKLEIKRKFYVSSRDVRIVCPRLYTSACFLISPNTSALSYIFKTVSDLPCRNP
jgi:hypothetical protein